MTEETLTTAPCYTPPRPPRFGRYRPIGSMCYCKHCNSGTVFKTHWTEIDEHGFHRVPACSRCGGRDTEWREAYREGGHLGLRSAFGVEWGWRVDATFRVAEAAGD